MHWLCVIIPHSHCNTHTHGMHVLCLHAAWGYPRLRLLAAAVYLVTQGNDVYTDTSAAQSRPRVLVCFVPGRCLGCLLCCLKTQVFAVDLNIFLKTVFSFVFQVVQLLLPTATNVTACILQRSWPTYIQLSYSHSQTSQPTTATATNIFPCLYP